MATYIDNIVKFHTFSKSPVSKDTTLGGAVNPSGHTVTTSQVRSQDIPAFLNTFQGTKEQALTWLGTNYSTPAHNDIVFYGGEFKAGFSTPKCLKWNAKLETPAWEDFDITTAATLKNADDKDVIAVHQNCTTVFVDGTNNAATNSNRNSLFVKKADGTILDHFVASTDKIVAGMPSLGYNALVLWNGAAIDEGELDANYIGNTFAGIVHLNKQYSTGDDAKFKVTCFEYIGEKLDTALGNIDGKIQDIVGTTMEGVVASVGTTDAAENAGISVDSSTKTSPKIDITTGTVGGASDAKLVTGSTVKTYVDEATSKATVSPQGVVTEGDENKLVTATGAQNIANKAASDEITAATLAAGQEIADTSETSKLVTAEQVKTYVSENAKVTLTQGTGITVTPNGESSTAFTVAVDDNVATAQSVTDLAGRVSETEEAIDSLTTGDNSVASQIANATLSATSTGGDKITVTLGGTVAAPTLSVVESDIASAQTLNAVKNTADSAVQTVTGDTYITATKTDTGVTLSTQISEIDAALADENSEVGAAIKAAASASTTLGSTTISSNDTDTGIKVELGGTVAAPTVDVTVTTATLGTDNKSFTTETSSNFAKASDVVTVATTIAAEKVASIETTGTTAITANNESISTKLATEASVAKTAHSLTAAIDAIAGVGVSYEVLGDDEKHESVTAPVKGRIYLEKDETAADGTYIEWFYTGTAWEKIGSTKADHSGYARTITINGETKTVSDNTVNLGKAVTSVTAGNGITSGTVSDTGVLQLTLDEASTTQKGILELASTHEAADTTKAATGATVASAISDIASTSQSDNGITVTTAGGSVTGVEVATTSLVNEDALVESVTDDNLITAADALAAITTATATTNLVTDEGTIIGNVADEDANKFVTASQIHSAISLAKPESYIISVADGKTDGEGNHTNVTSGQVETLVIKDSRENVYNNDLWGTSVTLDALTNTITVDQKYLSNPNVSRYSAWLTNVTKVEDNKAYNGDTVVANIQTDMIKDGSYMFFDTSLTSFSGDLSNLVNGDSMFFNTSLTSFSGDLSSLVNGSYMFNSSSLASFSGDLSNLVNGFEMFHYSSSLASFSGDLSSLVNGSYMFESCTKLTSFSGDLSSLVNGSYMFSYTSLDVESVELICDVLPNYNTEKLQSATWNTSEGKYTYSDWTSGDYYYPIIKISNDSDSMSQGNADGIDRSFGTDFISESNVKTITIYWDNISVLSEADRTAITKLFTDTATEKGWTFITNTALGGTVSPNAVMTTDGTIQYYVFAKKDEATEDNATHIDASGKLWKFDTAEAIIGPNIKYWSIFATVEDALTEWELTPWTKPTKEETEA